MPSKRLRLTLFFAPFTLISILSFIYRWDTFEPQSKFLNPDEAELLAMAKSIDLSEFGEGYLTSTNGPLLAYLLKILISWGLPVNFGAIHLLQFTVILGSILAITLFMYKRIKSIPHILLYLFCGNSLSVGLLFGSKWDYLSFCTETIPLVFLVVLTFLVFRNKKKHYFWIGMILGSILFLKIQILPLAVLVAFVGIVIVNLQPDVFSIQRILSVAIPRIIAGTSFFVFASIVILKINNAFDNWYSLSLKYSLFYSNNSISPSFGGGFSIFSKLKGATRLFLSDFSLSFITLSIFLFLIYFLLIFAKNFSRLEKKSFLRLLKIEDVSLRHFIIIFLLLLTNLCAFISVAIPGNLFGHYLLILYFSTFFSLIVSLLYLDLTFKLGFSAERSSKNYLKLSASLSRDSLLIIITISLVYLITHAMPRNSPYVVPYKEIKNVQISNEKNRLINQLTSHCKPGSKVLIWGYSAEMYVYADWTPVDNFVNDAGRFFTRGDSSRMQSILRDSVSKQIPDCILEATGSAYDVDFFREGPSISQFLQNLNLDLRDAYKLVLSSSDIGSLWIRKLP